MSIKFPLVMNLVSRNSYFSPWSLRDLARLYMWFDLGVYTMVEKSTGHEKEVVSQL